MQAQKAEAEAGLRSAKTELNAAEDNVEKVARGGKGHVTGNNYEISIDDWFGTTENDQASKILQKHLTGNAKMYSFNDDALPLKNYDIYAGSKDAKDIANLYNNIEVALAEMETDSVAKKSELYKDLNEWRKKMEEDETIQNYRKALKDTEEYTKEISSLDIKSKNLAGEYNNKSYEEIQQSVVDQLKGMDAFKDKTDEELKAIADMQLTNISGNIDDLQSRYVIIQNLLKALKDANWSEEEKDRLRQLNTSQLSDLQKSSK